MSAASLRIAPLFALFLLLCTCVLAQNTEQKAAPDLYDLGQIVEIELEMHDPNWKKKLNAWKKNNVQDRILATLKVNGEVFDSVGVRLKGNSSYFAPVRAEKKKLPFNIKVSHTHKEQRVQGKYRTLKLSNVFRDPSYLRESLSYAIARDYLSAPDCNYARLTVDGDYYGLYNLTESVDEQFWADEFDSAAGLLFKCDPESKDPPPSDCPPGLGANLSYLGSDSACYVARYELKKADHGWDELIAMTMALEDKSIKPETWLNVDETLWMLAFNNAMVNLDSYLGAFCHNYYLFQDASGVWRPVIWDLNLSVGGFRLVDRDEILTNEEMVKLSPFLHFADRNEERPLILRLFERPLFRKMYVAHLRTIYQEQFAEKQYLKRAEAIRETITAEVVQEPNPLYPTETYTQNFHNTVDISGGAVIGLLEFFEKRGEYLRDHPLYKQPVPEIDAHQALVDGDTVTVSVSLVGSVPAEAVWVAHRPTGAGNFRYSKLKPEADGSYVAPLPRESIQDYFLVAEGRTSATVLPARSAREWYRVEQGK